MNEGIVVIGYQGIGKSKLANSESRFVDLESGNFWIGGDRWDNWFVPYCSIAVDLASQGNIVFVSSHKVVRDQLVSMPYPKGVHVMSCVPAIGLREAWIRKLHDRFTTSLLDKDYKAWMNAVDRYAENIQEIKDTPIPVCEIASMDYSLRDVLLDFILKHGWATALINSKKN